MTGPRDCLWRAIRASTPGWSLAEVARIAGVASETAEPYLAFLAAAGFIRSSGRSDGEDLYMVTPAGRETLPTPTPEGIERITLGFIREVATGAVRLVSESAPGACERVRQGLASDRVVVIHGRRDELGRYIKPSGTKRDAIWEAICRLGSFRVGQVAQATGIKPKSVSNYLKTLRAAGIVALSEDQTWKLMVAPSDARPAVPDRSSVRRRLKQEAAS